MVTADPTLNEPTVPAPTSNPTDWRGIATLGVAVVALAGFAALVIYLLRLTDNASENQWNRAVYLLGGVEAIVFAATGYLFGREVHRQQAANAEDRADNAEKRVAVKERQVEAAQAGETAAAKQAILLETKGHDLAAAIEAKVQGLQARTGSPEFESFGARGAATLTQADLEELQSLAKALFPTR